MQSFFDLQVNETVKENKRENNDSVIKEIKKWKEHLKSKTTDNRMLNLSKTTANHQFSVLDLPVEDRLEMNYAPPDDLRLVGSWLLGTRIDDHVDVVLEFPSSLFRDKDYVNYRYIKKRFYWLQCVSLLLGEIGVECEWQWHGRGKYLPILVVNNVLNFQVRLHVMIDVSVLSVNKLSPSKNAVRATFENDSVDSVDKSKKNNMKNNSLNQNNDSRDSLILPTPHYNQMILRESMHSFHLDHLINKLQSQTTINAVILLKLWGRNRNLALNGFVISMLVAQCMESLPLGVTVEQIIKVFFNLLSKWNGPLIARCDNSKSLEHHFNVKSFQDHFNVVFVDSSGMINLLGDISSGEMNDVIHEATLALDMIDRDLSKSFEFLFLNVISPILKYDYIFKCRSVDCMGLERILVKGLGNRVSVVSVVPRQGTVITLNPIVTRETIECQVNMILSSEHSTEPMEVGPFADNEQESTEFRLFWGTKAEMRRFNDGSIREAAVFSCEPFNVVREIASHLLKHHFNATFDPCPFDSLTGLYRETDLLLMNTFQELVKQIKQLNTELSLSVSDVIGTSPGLRYTLTTSTNRSHKVLLIYESSTKWPQDIDAIQMMKIALLNELAHTLFRHHRYAFFLSPHGTLTIQKNNFHFCLRVFHEHELTLIEHPTPRAPNLPTVSKPIEFESQDEKKIVLNLLSNDSCIVTDLTTKVHFRMPVAFSCALQLIKLWLDNHSLAQLDPFSLSYNALEQLGAVGSGSSMDVWEQLVDALVCHLFTFPYPYRAPVTGHVALMRFFSLCSDLDSIQINDYEGSYPILQPSKISLGKYTFFRDCVNSVKTIRVGDSITINQLYDGKTQQLLFARLTHIARQCLSRCNKGDNWSVVMQPNVADFDLCLMFESKLFESIESTLKPLKSFESTLPSSSALKPFLTFEPKEFKIPDDKIGYLRHAIDFEPRVWLFSQLWQYFGKVAIFSFNPQFIGVTWRRDVLTCATFTPLSVPGSDPCKVESLKREQARKKGRVLKKVCNLPYPCKVTCNVIDAAASGCLPVAVVPDVDALVMEIGRFGSGIVRSIVPGR